MTEENTGFKHGETVNTPGKDANNPQAPRVGAIAGYQELKGEQRSYLVEFNDGEQPKNEWISAEHVGAPVLDSSVGDDEKTVDQAQSGETQAA